MAARYDAANFVRTTITSNPVVIFSKTYCPYSSKAKMALRKVGLDSNKILVIELDTRPDGDNVQDRLLELTGHRSIPLVFIDGEFLGGGDDTEAAVASVMEYKTTRSRVENNLPMNRPWRLKKEVELIVSRGGKSIPYKTALNSWATSGKIM